MMNDRYQFNEKKEAVGENEKHLNHELIVEKILICRAVTAEQFGSINVYAAAKNLYASLYSPESLDESIKFSEKFPDRMYSLKKPLDEKSKQIPTEENFIEVVKHAMIKEVDFGFCFSEESRRQLYDVMEKSETTVIWTDGDAFGVPEYQLPGSHEQILKIGSVKFFNEMRREIAKKRGSDHKDVLSIVATEGKGNFIPKLAREFKEREIKEVIIVEDRIKNLYQAILSIHQTVPDMAIFPIWIKQGQCRSEVEGNDKEMLDSIYIINDIAELMPVLDREGIFSKGKKVGAILDMDGVLSDDGVRRKIQTDAVIAALRQREWI